MSALEVALYALAAGMGALTLRGLWRADGLRMALEAALIRRGEAERELARLKAKRSDAVARGNRTRAAKNRAKVLAKAQEMQADMARASTTAAEQEADQAMADDAAQMPLGLG